MRSRTWLWALVVTLPTLWIAACSSDDDDEGTTGPGASSSSGSGASGGTGATGGTETGGTGGTPIECTEGVEGADACPGAAVDLAIDECLQLSGDTAAATDDYMTFCGDMSAEPDAGDLVWEVSVAGGGTLRVELDDAAGFDGVVSIRKTMCEARVGEDECINVEADNEDSSIDAPAGTYFVVVDGSGGTQGTFDMRLTLTAAACGDGVVNESVGEECDPEVIDEEVCFPPGDPDECTLKPPPLESLETCPGYPVAIDAGDELVLGEFNNTTYLDEHIGVCAGGNTGGRDHVFQFTPSADGTLTLTIGNDPATQAPWCDTCGAGCQDGDGCWAMILYARSGACEQGTGVEVGCAFDETFADPTPSISFAVTADTPYWVYVDSTFNGAYTAGPYYLEASLQ